RTLFSLSLVPFVSLISSHPLILCSFFFKVSRDPRVLHSFPTRRSSDLHCAAEKQPFAGRRIFEPDERTNKIYLYHRCYNPWYFRSEEHTSELQSRFDLVCRLLLEKKKKKTI